VEHVQEALIEMRDHLLMLAERPEMVEGDGLETTFNSLLESRLASYNMASQTVTHLSVAGGTALSDHNHLAIELF